MLLKAENYYCYLELEFYLQYQAYIDDYRKFSIELY